MGLVFGNKVHGNQGSSSTLAVTLSYSAGSVIICDVAPNSGPIISVVSTALGSFTFYATSGGGQPIERWVLKPGSSQTSDTITMTQSATNFITADVYEWKGVDLTSTFDAGGPVTNGGLPSDPSSITTVNANTAVIACFRQNSTASPTAGSGFTLIGGANFMLSEYQILAATQTLSCTETTGAGDSHGSIVDALVAAASAVTPYDPWPQWAPLLSQ